MSDSSHVPKFCPVNIRINSSHINKFDTPPLQELFPTENPHLSLSTACHTRFPHNMQVLKDVLNKQSK